MNLVVGARTDSNRFAGLMAWDILRGMGHFPPGTPPTLRTHIHKGRRSPEELVDFHGVRDPDVRQLIIDYIVRRQGDIDYVTREGLARAIAGSFRSGIEKIAPGQRDFDIASEVYDQWRETVRVRKGGSPRVGGGTGLLLPVRAYGASAGGDAGSRSGWPTGFASASRCCRRSSRTSRSATRACGSCWWPRSAPLDGVFATAVAPTSGWALAPISAIATIRSSRWEWACVEVLRPTGVRAEELVELAHTGIRQYERPNGEVIALLVIAPSKTDRERVIPMPAELFHVIATIVLRQTAHDPIPLVPRYDGHDRKWTAPMPHLFQR